MIPRDLVAQIDKVGAISGYRVAFLGTPEHELKQRGLDARYKPKKPAKPKPPEPVKEWQWTKPIIQEHQI